MSFVIGENVGPYRIVEQLGQGGMATVYKAYHASLDRYVAIKVLHPAFKEDPNFLARFQREARVVARLEHPHIVPVYDFAEHNASPYLVMKFIEGETLKARLQRGPVGLRETQRILDAVGAGLDYAHKQGILHRDIKSSNIMLAEDGGVYLADFGLARIAVAGESTLSMDSMIGTPHYMSPEQARGVKDLDAGTDIYSLGVVVYELVVGRLPYSADTPFAIIHDHIYTPLPMPRTVNANVPPAIERVLLKTLAKERADRYPDVGALAAAFREAVTGVASDVVALPGGLPAAPSAPTAPGVATVAAAAAPAPPAKAPARKGFNWGLAALVVGGVLVLGLGGLLVVNQLRRQAAPLPTLAPTPAPAATQPPVETPVPPPTEARRATLAAPPGGQPAWLPAVDAAAKLFQQGAPKDALAALQAAVDAQPNDPGLRLAAGDLTLSQGLALDALVLFYRPGLGQVQGATDPVAAQLRNNTALAMYAAAADPGAEKPLLEMGESGLIQDASVNLAFQRWRLFNADTETARIEIERVVQGDRDANGAQLVYGDYFLRQAQPGLAEVHYLVAQRPARPNAAVPAWVIKEADCRLRQLRDQREGAKLTPTCEPLAALVAPPPQP